MFGIVVEGSQGMLPASLEPFAWHRYLLRSEYLLLDVSSY